MTDDEICDHVLSEQVPDQDDEPEPEEVESDVCPVSNSMATHMHVYLYNVVFDCISLIRTFHLSEQSVCGI